MAAVLFHAGASRAATLGFSDASSDNTPAEWLAATLDYALVDPGTLELSVRNETAQPTAFDVTLIFFNVLPEVQYLTLTSATSSLDGDNTSAWTLGHYDYDRVTV